MEYRRHFLSRVIFQANFNIDSLKTGIHPSLIDLCKLKTGVAHPSESKNTDVSFIPGQKIQSQVSSRWVFKGENLEILVQHNLIQIINLKYTNHNDFHSIIEELFNNIRMLYSPIFTRVALRYINKIYFPEGSTFDFDNLINSKLVSPTVEYKDLGLTRSIGVMNFQDDDVSTNFTYGFVNSEFPNRIARREFYLDYDCFLNLRNTIDSVQPLVLRLRNRVNDLFEKSILDGLREKML